MATLEKAVEIAALAHAGQLDRAGKPYLLHPLRIMLGLGDPDAQIAAALHDVVEDSDRTLEELQQEGFSAAVMQAVDLLTHRPGVSYDDYIEAIAASPLATAVKLGDLLDNMNLQRLPEVRDKDLQRYLRYRKAFARLGGTAG